MPDYPNVSLMITHYSRSTSLERLFILLQQMHCTFGEIIVSDDGSSVTHLNYIEKVLSKRFPFKLIKATRNKGLGNNMNKGQDAVTKPYTLYIQEDFEPQPLFPEILEQALQCIQKDQSIDLVRFFAHYPYPYLKPYNKNKNFSISDIPPLAIKYKKIYNYSDLPHLRRSNFFEKFGRFRERLPGDRTEYWMCVSFFRNKGVSLFYNEHNKLFKHNNSEHEPSTMARNTMSTSRNIIIAVVRNLYRQMKYNYDIFFRKLN